MKSELSKTKHRQTGSPSRVLTLLLSLAMPVLATTVTPPEFIELVRESDYVVRAVVKSVTAELKTKAEGRPTLYSWVELEVKQVIAGQPPSPLVLRMLGGRLGDREMFISGAPRFIEGEEAVFFVQGNGRQIYPLVRIMHGLYPIIKDAATGREYVVRSNGEPLVGMGQISQPMHAHDAREAQLVQATAGVLTPDDFAAQIRAVAKESNAIGK